MLKDKIIKQISTLIVLTLIIGLMSAFVLPKNTEADEQETTETEESSEVVVPDEYELIAHRGYSSVAPENSLPAFQKAVNAGYKHIEFDIVRTKEDEEGHAEWVVSHDQNLKRLFGVDEDISELTVDEIKQYSYIAGNDIGHYKNLKMLSLSEIIDYMKEVKASGKDVNWKIEIKTLEDTSYRENLGDEVVKLVEEADLIDNVTFLSFHYTYLNHITKANENAHTWFLAEVFDDKYFGYAEKCKKQPEGITFQGSAYTTDEEIVKEAIQKGYKMGVYTIDNIVTMGSYYTMGVRSFTTNKVNPDNVSIKQMKQKYKMKEFKYTLSKTSYTYDSYRKRPSVKVTYDGEELIEGLSYEISYSNNKYPGTAIVTVTGVRNCTSEIDNEYTINMPKVKGFTITGYTTNSVSLKWTANKTMTGYKVYQYNYKTKKYKLIKTIKKNTTKTCKVKKLLSSKKYRFRIKMYLKVNNKDKNSKACTGKTVYTIPDKEKMIKIKRSKKGGSCKISFEKQARVTGYIIYLSTNKNFYYDNRVIVTKTKKGFVNSYNLIKNKAYYAKVCAYKKVKNKYYYGKFSKTVRKKGVKIKKKKKKKKKSKSKKKKKK